MTASTRKYGTRWRHRCVWHSRLHVDLRKLNGYLRARQVADFDDHRVDQARCSVHFPLGRFPQLYQESDDRPHVEWEPGHALLGQSPRGGYRRSIYTRPLQRAGWIIAARQKPSMSDYLVHA